MNDFSVTFFQPWALVALVMAVLTAFVAVDLHCRSIEARPKPRRHWLVSTGIALGTGYWAVLTLGIAVGPAHADATFNAGLLLGVWVLAVAAAIVAVTLHATASSKSSSARLGAAAGLGGIGMSATALALIQDAGPRSAQSWSAVALAGSVTIFGLAGMFALLQTVQRGEAVARTRRMGAIGWLASTLVAALGAVLWLGHVGRAAPLPPVDLNTVAVTLIASVGGLAMLGTIASAIVAQAHLQRSLRSANEALQRQTVTDLLTDLPNRQVFDQQLVQAAEEAEREKQSLAVICVNLDGFKPVNERLGHKTGDDLLRETARRLKEFFGSETLVARMGADEFVVLVRRGVSEETMNAIAGQLLDRLSAPMRAGETTLKLPGSVGIALFPQHGTAPTLIAHAEAAMRTAKLQGGATYRMFQRQMLEGAREQAELLRDLKFALSTKQLELYYQPKIDAPSGQITGCEALLRWNHPKRGPVSPALFIPLAEEHGLINVLGQWVLEAVCEQIAAWREAGLQMRVAVNLSVHQLRQPGLAGQIAEALKRNSVEPKLLTCEITESVAMGDAHETIQLLNRLAAVGVHLSIDDFGTGYSSLAYLRKLPAEELKIDRSFVLDLETSEDARSVVDAVVRLAKALGLKVVAEGVETEEQARILRDMGCTQLQGHLFAKPMTANALTIWAMHREGPSPISFRESLYQDTRLLAEV